MAMSMWVMAHIMHVTRRGKNNTRLHIFTFSMIHFNSNNSACRTTELESVNIGDIFSKRTERLVVNITGCDLNSSLSPFRES